MALVVLKVNSEHLPHYTADQLTKWVQDELNMTYDRTYESAYGELKGQEIGDVKVMRVIEL